MTADADSRAHDLCAERPYLLRFAMVRLRDPDLAQDAVQDTLLAALDAKHAFAGRSAYRTWLTGILKHKIVDLRRQSLREGAFSGVGDDSIPVDNDTVADLAVEPPAPETDWGNPEKHLDRTRFWATIERGLDTLSPKAAAVWVMRDVHGHATEDICTELGVSASNCWVILHRSRSLMRGYLDAQGYHA